MEGNYTEAEITNIRRGVYAGTFDPPTNGHLWVIEQGALLFDELEVSVGVNPDKQTRFSVEERVEMLEAITEPYPNVNVGQFENLFLVDYARANGYEFILRGLRSGEDFSFEKIMNNINKEIQPEVKAVYLLCPGELDSISSSLVRGLVGPEGWEHVVAQFVPEFVLAALKKHHPAKA